MGVSGIIAIDTRKGVRRMLGINKLEAVLHWNDIFTYRSLFLLSLTASTTTGMRIMNSPPNSIENCSLELKRKWVNSKLHQICPGSKSNSSKMPSIPSAPVVKPSNGVMPLRILPSIIRPPLTSF